MTLTTPFRQELDAWRLSRYGERVRRASGYLSLAGRGGLWLVVEGELDLLAYGKGRWRPLGRLGAGALVPSSAPGPAHVLVARPLPGCTLYHLPFGISEDSAAVARGVDLGLAPLLSAVAGPPVAGTATLVPGYPVELRPGDAARPVTGIVWLRVLEGRIGTFGPGAVLATDDTVSAEFGAVVTVDTTAGMLDSGVLWPHLAAEEIRLRHLLLTNAGW
jgi:hypothetical protein